MDDKFQPIAALIVITSAGSTRNSVNQQLQVANGHPVAAQGTFTLQGVQQSQFACDQHGSIFIRVGCHVPPHQTIVDTQNDCQSIKGDAA